MKISSKVATNPFIESFTLTLSPREAFILAAIFEAARPIDLVNIVNKSCLNSCALIPTEIRGYTNPDEINKFRLFQEIYNEFKRIPVTTQDVPF